MNSLGRLVQWFRLSAKLSSASFLTGEWRVPTVSSIPNFPVVWIIAVQLHAKQESTGHQRGSATT